MGRNESLSFLTNFTNLQVLVLSDFEVKGFQALHHVNFTRLKVLKFNGERPYHADLMKFLERNGRNLELLRFHGDDDANDDYFNLNLMNFCPNLKTLRTRSEGDVGGLMNILKGFQQLESLEVCKDYESITIKIKLLEVVVNHAPKSFYELKVRYEMMDEMDLSDFADNCDLKPVLMRWANRMSRKPLSLIIIDENGLDLMVVAKFGQTGNSVN